MHYPVLLYFLHFNLFSIYLRIRGIVKGFALFSLIDELLKWAVAAVQGSFLHYKT